MPEGSGRDADRERQQLGRDRSLQHGDSHQTDRRPLDDDGLGHGRPAALQDVDEVGDVHTPLAQQVGHLHEALATRDLIGQAKGVLMERYKISPHEAFVLLTTVSSQTNTKLRDVAEQLATTGVLTGERPGEAAEPQDS